MPEERAGGANTYDAPHLRYRDYYADMRVTVALRLEPDADDPTLEALGGALQEPARPLFIGRKPCLPSAPLFARFTGGDAALGALLEWPLARPDEATQSVRLMWPSNDGRANAAQATINRNYMLTDQRNWVSGLHGGGREVCEGVVDRDRFPSPAKAQPVEKDE